MRFFFIFIILLNVFFTQSCVSTAIICSAVVATKSVGDPRSIIQQVDDTILETRINLELNKNKNITKKSRIIVVVYKGNVLLIGESPYLHLSEYVKQIVTNVKDTKEVYNEIRNGYPINITTMLNDTLITTIIKSKILISNVVKLGNIKVITENSEVFLLGIVTKQEGNNVSKLVSSINGISKVVTAFNYLN
ncbi:division/outer membrane stress-associated lipid-binding lipoprotein [Candidatus Providencia siddallii]|uniref:Uncharacterized protein YraP n=1 Tax=Candidatus Providencia siddallii TaxID=1715285 RepID=A0ABM9NP02_9GAMM